MYTLTTLPVIGYEIQSNSGDEPEQFNGRDFETADARINELRELSPQKTFKLIALIDA